MLYINKSKFNNSYLQGLISISNKYFIIKMLNLI